MNPFPVLQENQDPNLTKNRIPIDRERQFLLQLIEREEKKVAQLDAEIQSLNTEAAITQGATQEYESMLTIAHELVKCTEAALKAVQDVSQGIASLSKRSETWSPPESIPRAVYNEMLGDQMKLQKRHVDDLSVAREDFARASTREYKLEEELDASCSMLVFTQRSISLLVDLKTRTQVELLPKKDLVGARRRVPAELWAQIFRERLEEDEESFQLAGREGVPPFTALKVSWVCIFWRAIAHGQPTLWQYIAIPRATEVSHSQWERVKFYLSLAKACQPIVYVAPESRGDPRSALSTTSLLQQFRHFRKLELRVSRRTSEAEELLAAIEPSVDELVLIGTHKAGASGTSCPLKYSALAKVQKITCIHLQPQMRLAFPPATVLNVTTAKFVQHTAHPRSILQFLEACPSIKEVEMDILPPYSADLDTAPLSVSLPGIKRITASLEVLYTLFTREIMLPNLEHIAVQSSSGDVQRDSETLWDGFTSIDSRSSSIKSLKLGTLFFPLNKLDTSEAYARMIKRLPQLHSLHLTDDAAPHSLEGMALTKSIPGALKLLHLSGKAVEEDHIANFLRCFHMSRNAALELLFPDCPKISESGKLRLARLDTA